MSSEEKKNGPSWEATFSSRQPAATSQAGDKPHQPEKDADPFLPEDRFLVAEAESAKAAILQTLHDLNSDLREVTDVRYWTRLHPWIAVGVATAAGLAVGAIAGSAGAGKSHATDGHAAAAERQESASQKGEHKPLTSTILRWLRNLLSDLSRTFATALAANAVQAVTRAADPSSPVLPPDSQDTPHRTDGTDTTSASSVNSLGGGAVPDEATRTMT
jgi:hypothetical protein